MLKQLNKKTAAFQNNTLFKKVLRQTKGINSGLKSQFAS